MKTSKQDLYELASRYASGEATPEEIRLLEKAYMNASQRIGFSDAQQNQAERIDQIGKKSWEELISRINKEENKHHLIYKKLWLRAGIAAAVAMVVFGVWFFNYRAEIFDDALDDKNVAYQNDVAPGKNDATLTLANGKTISLSDAESGVVVGSSKIMYGDQTLISDVGRNERMVIKTPRGGTYHITLSDGTKVWLNAASSLVYSPLLNKNNERRVLLEGEAYFEVAKDKAHPFIVESKGQEIKVLGTHFNVNSYPDEPVTRTTLLEGSVKVNNTRIMPGQRAVLTGNTIKVEKANLDGEMAWKNGDFLFDGEDFRAAMRKVARWYDVEVVYDPLVPERIKLGGWVSRSKNLSAVLKVLESTGEVHFKVTGRRIIVER